MSLQVWLPLNGNLNNNGVANVSITNNGATVDNNGKIGKCYSFGASKYLSIPNILTTSSTAFSFSCWVYVTQYTDGYTCVYCSRTTTSGKGIALWITSSYIRVDDGENWQNNYTFQLNTWTHITITWNKTAGKKIFVNGTLLASKATVGTLSSFDTNLYIGYSMAGSSSYALVGKVNDFRIYDHTLSEKEVKEISKGLVLHYPLNGNGRSGNNLITNSTGYNGTSTWTGLISVGMENNKPYFITKRTDTTSTSRTFIYKSSGITSIVSSWEPGTKFTISGYYRIPSSETYNVQANLFIRWRLSTGSDYDSNFVTPTSGIITDKWIRFEQTYSVPTNYSGGTVNFYLAAFAKGLSTVHWKNIKMEKGDKATSWCPNSADAEYTKMGYNLTTEYDTSGNKYNGSKIGTLSYDTDSARFSTSSIFNGTDNGILIENLPLSNIINTEVTYSFWIKPNGENGARSVYFGSYSGTSWSVEKTTGNILRLFWNGNPDDQCSGTTITDDIWQHICITKKGTSDIKVYINGVQKWSSTSAHNNLTFPTTYRIGRDTRSGDGTPYKGLMSDFRIYATALSADDVKALYNTSASISNTGVLMSSGEFVET